MRRQRRRERGRQRRRKSRLRRQMRRKRQAEGGRGGIIRRQLLYLHTRKLRVCFSPSVVPTSPIMYVWRGNIHPESGVFTYKNYSLITKHLHVYSIIIYHKPEIRLMKAFNRSIALSVSLQQPALVWPSVWAYHSQPRWLWVWDLELTTIARPCITKHELTIASPCMTLSVRRT